jgi:hypothetical protein
MGDRALLVGVNRYRLPGSDLSGCLNDVANVRELLTGGFSFAAGDVRILVDEGATRAAIMEGLQWLVGGTRPGDRRFFHFSGHGSQVPDTAGDERRDHLDEILCPHDMDWGGTYVEDDALGEVFSGLPRGSLLEVWLDCCHSGTGIRVPAARAAPQGGAGMRPRFLPMPGDLAASVGPDPAARGFLRGLLTPGQVLWAGCRDDQTSADAFIDGGYNGAFTYHLCGQLRGCGGLAARREVLARLRAALKEGGFDQVPQLECSRPARGGRVLEAGAATRGRAGQGNQGKEGVG